MGAKMAAITLTTDFGLKDGYAGVLKGVIWSIAPDVQVADISHSIEPQNILHGALVLARHGRYFPPGTVHLAVVDPGVGTQRRPLAARIGEQYFVGPDNGLCSQLAHAAIQDGEDAAYSCLDQPQYWLAQVSPVFHGRDIFAPVAAHLASGVPLEKLGSPISDPVTLEIPTVQSVKGRLAGQVLYVDAFGSLVTNPDGSLLDGGISSLEINGILVTRQVKAYAEALPGELVMLAGSAGLLEAAVVNGSAAALTGAGTGTEVLALQGDEL